MFLFIFLEYQSDFKLLSAFVTPTNLQTTSGSRFPRYWKAGGSYIKKFFEHT